MLLYIHRKGTLWFSILFLLCVSLFLSSCKNSRISKLNDKEELYVGKVLVSAGDHIDYVRNDTLKFMTYPFNVALFSDKKDVEKEVYIIGKKVDKGDKIAFRPFAKLTFENAVQGRLEEVVLAIPAQKDRRTAEINDYFEFISVHYGVQQVVESWTKSARGFGSVKNLTWSDEQKAKDFLAF